MERYAIGIDLGGTSVKYAVVASSGKMPFSGQLPAFAQESAEAVLGQVLKGVEACREYAVSEGLMLAGVGVGTPGVVSADGRTVLGGAEPVVVKIVQKGVVPVLTVTPTQLDFDDPDAAFKIVEVTASHVEWQVEQSAEKWITAEADREAGTIRVSVEENTDAAPRNGTFRITGEGVEPVTVTVTQPSGSARSLTVWGIRVRSRASAGTSIW